MTDVVRADLVNIAAGIFLISGGGFAFLTKGSKPSLVAGATSGALFIGSGLLVKSKPQSPAGLLAALGLSTALAGYMARRVAASKHWLSAPTLIVGVATLLAVFNFAAWWKLRQQ